jgi:endonuclease YncB( thermonuclease family)
MRRFSIFIVVLVISAQWTSSVSADAVISGPACVIDGNTLQIGGKVKNHNCWGGIDVRLHGSISPKSNEMCTDTVGKTWDCGKKAKDALTRMIRQHSISCFHIDGEFEDGVPIVTCISGRLDLAREMVVIGLSKSLHDQNKRYELEERDAKRAKRGLWK